MHKSGQAQPALLYIVPCLQLALILCAAFKGELKWMWKWSEADEEQQKTTKSEKNKNHVEDNAEATKGIAPADDKNDILKLVVPISEVNRIYPIPRFVLYTNHDEWNPGMEYPHGSRSEF